MKTRPFAPCAGPLRCFRWSCRPPGRRRRRAARRARPSGGNAASITPTELKEWLSYIASDELQGRQVFTEGLGLAAAYIADHLKEWGIKPGGTTAATSRSSRSWACLPGGIRR